MAKSKAACSPLAKGAEISAGKKPRPVSTAAWCAGSRASTAGPTRCWMGL